MRCTERLGLASVEGGAFLLRSSTLYAYIKAVGPINVEDEKQDTLRET